MANLLVNQGLQFEVFPKEIVDALIAEGERLGKKDLVIRLVTEVRTRYGHDGFRWGHVGWTQGHLEGDESMPKEPPSLNARSPNYRKEMTKFPEDLRPHLQRLLDACKGSNPERSALNADDALEAETIERVQQCMRDQGAELTYGEAFDLWENVNLDSQQTWVEAHSSEGVLIELQRLCEHIRDGCDYAGISNPD